MFIRLSMGIASFFIFLGCSKAPSMQRYLLQAPQTKSVVTKRVYLEKTLKVSYPQARLLPLDEQLYFTRGASKRGTYENAQWQIPFGRLLQERMIEAFQQPRHFKAIVTQESSLSTDFRLESAVSRCEHQVTQKGSFAHLVLEIDFIDERRGVLLKHRRFSYMQKTKEVNAKGYVDALNHLFERFRDDLVVWIEER